MTLLHINTQIISILCQDNYFSEDNFSSIDIKPELEENRKDLIETAIQELISANFIRQVGKNKLWIMILPPGSQGQPLTLNLHTCTAIADTINTFSKVNNLEIDTVNPLEINESHIINILEIIQDLISDEDKDE
jgi:hypothetical protein